MMSAAAEISRRRRAALETIVGVEGGRGRRRDLVGQVGQVDAPADVLERAVTLERDGGRDDVDRLAPGEQATQRGVDATVRRTVEVVGLEDLDDVGDGLVRQEHRAEHRGLGLHVVRRQPMPFARRQASNIVGRTRHLPLPLGAHVAAGPAPQPGDATPGGHEATVDNHCGLFPCRSRSEIPCHSASDLRFPHVDNHVEQCESQV